ncbi:MAG TPA: YCF48-related protein [Pyrinomonadaceae bacterium]|nr:YCF48-related protein [Pyrinomonadaceae bacterium]
MSKHTIGAVAVDRSRKIFLSCSCMLLLLLSVSVSTFAQSGTWARQRAGTMAWLHAVFFLDHNRGWAVGSKGTVLQTLDGGNTWKARGASTDDVVRDIFFIDDKNGWLVCEVNAYQLKDKDPRAYLMKTTDGGNNWTKIEIKGFDIDAILVRAVFTRNGRGWVFGEAGSIYTTHDGGETWSVLKSPTRRLLLGGMFVDDDRGWIVGAGATIIQTSDGGETWYQSTLPQVEKTTRFTATFFVDNRRGWAVGSVGSVYSTINGGRTWQRQEAGVLVDLLDVKFVNALEGWAVGHEGTIISTRDGGEHWTVEKSGTGHPLERVFFTDRNRGWAVGFGGTVVAYLRDETSATNK